MSLKNYPPPRSTGICDDLEFLLEEDLSSVQLCALHIEMRNTKQLLGSIGLVAYNIDLLHDANDALRHYGPESFKGNRLTVQKKAGQESAVGKHNIHVSSMSGTWCVSVIKIYSLRNNTTVQGFIR